VIRRFSPRTGRLGIVPELERALQIPFSA
jgi:hypothetical protein